MGSAEEPKGATMARTIKDPRTIDGEIIADYQGACGDDLVSIILYGSAVGKDYRPGKSDINFMLLLTEGGIAHLGKALKLAEKWKLVAIAPP